MGIYKYPPSLEGQVFYSLLTFTLVLVLSPDLSIRSPAGTTPPPVVIAAQRQQNSHQVKDSPAHHPF
jgi:hypothetical protein